MDKVFILLLCGQTLMRAIDRLMGTTPEQSTFWGIFWIITVVGCIVATIMDTSIKWWKWWK